MTMHMSTAGFNESIAAHLSAVEKQVELAINITVIDIQREGKRDCPVGETGELMKSHGAVFAGTSITIPRPAPLAPLTIGKLPKLLGAVVVAMPYAPFVHDGTSKMAARPWLEAVAIKARKSYMTKLAAAMKGV